MPSNFDFLQPNWNHLHEDAVQAERHALTAPRTSAFYCRRTMERAVKWLYAHDSYLNMPYQDNLAAMIHEQTFKDTLAPGLFNQVRMIHKLGNMAVHSDTTINAQDGLNVTKCLYALLSWLAKAYTQGAPTVTPFDEQIVPAVADEFFVPPKPVSVPLKFQRKGVKYDGLSHEEKQEHEEKFYDEETDSWPQEIDAGALNQWLFNTDTVDKVLAHLMERGLKVEGGDRLGKTVIFAKNHNHAEFIVER